jgi:GTPase KRas protein
MFSTRPKAPATRSRAKSEVSRLNLTIMGPCGVGKSCLVLRLISNEFVEDCDPTVEDEYRQTFVVDQIPQLVSIMDTAGLEEFDMLEDQWIRVGEGFLLVFDVTQPSTISEVANKYNRIRRQKEMDDVPVVLVGNKMDMLIERGETSSPAIALAKAFAQKWGCHYIEASAKSDMNVTQCFEESVRAVRKWRAKNDTAPGVDSSWCSIL